MSPKRLYRTFAVAEAITWTLLIAGMILKYGFGLDVASKIGGGIHGFVFLAYVVVAVVVGVNQRWTVGRIAFALFTAIVPYATIPFELWLVRRGHLEGGWRSEAGEDPADGSFPNRVLRLVLARPAISVAVGVVAVAAAFTVLLVIGPPVPPPAVG